MLRKQQQELDERKRSEREHALLLRYRGIMFTERQKARRRLKQVEKKLASEDASGGDLDSLQSDRLRYLEDIAYTRWFPRGQKYISLYPSREMTEADMRRRDWLRKWALANAAAEKHLPDPPELLPGQRRELEHALTDHKKKT